MRVGPLSLRHPSCVGFQSNKRATSFFIQLCLDGACSGHSVWCVIHLVCFSARVLGSSFTVVDFVFFFYCERNVVMFINVM